MLVETFNFNISAENNLNIVKEIPYLRSIVKNLLNLLDEFSGIRVEQKYLQIFIN